MRNRAERRANNKRVIDNRLKELKQKDSVKKAINDWDKIVENNIGEGNIVGSDVGNMPLLRCVITDMIGVYRQIHICAQSANPR